MTWIPRADAPSSFSLSQAFAALIAGDLTWSWLAQWVPLIPPATYDTDGFCSAGPYPASPLTAADFLSALGTNPYAGLFVGSAIIGQNLSAVAMNRVFGAYCINRVTAPAGMGWTEPVCLSGAYAVGPRYGPHIPKPAGATRLRLSISHAEGTSYFGVYNTDGSGFDTGGWHTEGYSGPPDLVAYWDIPESVGYCYMDCEGTVINYCVSWYAPTTGVVDVPYTPTPQPRPSGVVLPAAGDYPDIPSLGRELDALELKMEYALSILASMADQTAVPVGPAGDPQEIVDEQPVDVTGAAGLVVTITTLPPSADEEFGTPPLFHRLGHVIFSGPDGYGPVISVETTPLVILPIPNGRTNAVLRMKPGTVGHIRLIPKAIPLGQRS